MADERERGLPFDHPVALDLLPEADYVESLNGPDDDTSGYYDGTRMVVRGTELTPPVQLTVVHELTHALQDQHFDIFALDRSGPTRDQQVAYNSLLESDATRVHTTYQQVLIDRGVDPETLREPLPSVPLPGDGAELEDGAGSSRVGLAGGAGRPWRPADRTLPGQRRPGLPYGWEIPTLVDAVEDSVMATGGQLVAVLLQQGGNAAVDGAFRDPPRTTEQVLDARVYLAHDEARTVDPPRPRGAEGSVEPQTSVGALNLYLVLAAGIDPLQALDAVTGWGGDSVVSYEDAAGRVCIDVAVVGDTEADTAEIGSAFATWAASGLAEEASTAQRADGAQVLTACGIGARSPDIEPMQATLLFQLRGIQAREAMRDGGLGIDAALAFGDCVIRSMPMATIVGVDVDLGPTPEAMAELDRAASTCR